MSNNSKSNWTKHLDFFISDLLAVVASFFVANALMHNIWGRVGNSYQVLLVVLIIFDLLVAIFGASYRNILRRDRYRELISMFIHVATVAVLVIIALFGLKISASYSRLFIGYFSISFFLVGYAFRIILKRIVRLRILKSGNRRMLVIAPKKYVAQTIKGIRSDYYSGISLSGVILSDEEENSGGEEECIENVPVIPIKELEEYIKTNIVDEIVMNGAEGSAYLSELIDDCLNSGVTVHSVNQRFA
ncbi:MAG: hypothetical protein LBQ95_01210, partial [Lachnospiraceae bacterium]|nr:hypothetical protein [Lachnospiraceae bacterium]